LAELQLIEWIRTHALPEGAGEVLIGPGDDTAVLGVGAERIAFATDAVVCGVHFGPEAPGRAVGWKALAANISDLAAMGAEPVACVGAVALASTGGGGGGDGGERGGGEDYGRAKYAGLAECAAEFGCPVVGGDVSAAPEGSATTLAVSVIGRFGEHVQPVLRSGAEAGQAVYVTGELGGSGAGRHLSFTPRLAEGLWLAREGLAQAMIDVSDGLATDLRHICRESGVGACIDEAAVPVSAAAREGARATGRPGRTGLEHALCDGEDFELLFTVAAADCARLESAWPSDVGLTRIGETTGDRGRIVLRAADGAERPLELGGYEHDIGGGGGGGSDPARPGRRGEPAGGGEHDGPAPGAILNAGGRQ